MEDNTHIFSSLDFSLANMILTIGFFVAIWLLTRTVHEKKLSLTFLNDHITLFALSALFVGRIGAVINIYPAISEKMIVTSSFLQKTWIFVDSFVSFWHGGIDVVWAFGGFLIVFLLFCSLKNEHPLAWLDAFSLPSVIFLIFFSLASFHAGWNYGSPVSDSYWFATSYPDNNEVQYSGSIHPVQLYATILLSIILLGGIRTWSRKIREEWPNGIFGGILTSSLFFTLSFLEFFRGEISYRVFNFFPIHSLIFFGVGLSIIIFMLIRGHFKSLSQVKKIISQ